MITAGKGHSLNRNIAGKMKHSMYRSLHVQAVTMSGVGDLVAKRPACPRCWGNRRNHISRCLSFVHTFSSSKSLRDQLRKFKAGDVYRYTNSTRLRPCRVKKIAFWSTAHTGILSRCRIRSAMGRIVAADTRSLSLRHTKQAIWPAVWFVFYDTGARVL